MNSIYNKAFVLVIGVMTTFLIVSDAGAGSLRGRVTMGFAPRVQQSSMNPYPGTLGSAGETPSNDNGRSDPRDVVLYLTGTGAPRTGATSENPKIYQLNQNFEPHVLGIPIGTEVDFPNRDMIFHNVFSYSKTKRFDLGYFGKNKSKSVVFDKPGLVKVFCDIHSNMAAYILVVDTPLIVQPGENGAFDLAHVPDGRYKLTTWHPTRGERTRDITIVGDTTIDLNL